MQGKILGIVVVAVALATTAAVRLSWSPEVQVTDFGSVSPPATVPYPAELVPASAAAVKEFRIPIRDATIEIAEGKTYTGWTFGGSVPGLSVSRPSLEDVYLNLIGSTS